MTRQDAAQFARTELNLHGLQKWGVRLNQDANGHFLGLCSYKDECIILNAHHIDIHPDADIKNTVRHEIAHALTPGHRHDEVWAAKAKEVGCDNTAPCSHLSLSPEIIDAIRSGATVEVEFDEQVIRTPRYKITRLQDKCEVCGKVAKTAKEQVMVNPNEDLPDLKMITLECGHVVCKKIPKGTPFHKLQAFGWESPDCKHEFLKNSCVKCSRKRMFDFQIEGAKFGEIALSTRNGVAFFDEMGLGKTIQAIAVLYFHPEYEKVLWIVKSALKYQTSSALINWMGDAHIPQIINTSKDALLPYVKHYIIGYDMLVPKVRQMKSGKTAVQGFDINKFTNAGIKCIVLDECQQIKNVDSTRTQQVRRIVKNTGAKVIGMSGTPWNNRGSELFPILNMLDPMKFNSEADFKRRWVSYGYQGQYLKEFGIKNIKMFKEHVKEMCIRRERTEVMSELPLVNRTKLYVQMDLTQESIYDEAVESFVQWFEEQKGNSSAMAIIAQMAKMRHLVALAKIPATLEYIDEFVEDTDRKIVVFAHHQDVQDMLFDALREKYGKDMPVLQFVAGMNGEKVDWMQKEFNNNKRAIMVASQLAAGEGLNLQTCCDCIMHERQWNPGKEEQAEGRFIRIGSVATSVNSIYTHMQGLTAIDSALDGIVERKRVQFHSLMNKGEAAPWNQDSIVKELAETIVRAHRAKKNRK